MGRGVGQLHGRRRRRPWRSQGAHRVRGSSEGDSILAKDCREPRERYNWRAVEKRKKKSFP